MWHVDEGALHAYLDGALDEYPAAEARRLREHLETCGACAERLAEERRVREEADEILGLASPRVEIPTLEELRAYVKAQQPPLTRARSRLHRLSWAASVVLALGTGWLLRGGMPPTMAASDRDRGAASAGAGPAAQLSPAAELEAAGKAGPDPARETAEEASPAAPDAIAGAQRVAPPATPVTAPQAGPSGVQDAQRAAAAAEPRRELAERPAATSPAGAVGRAPAASLADAGDAGDPVGANAAASGATDDAAADLVAARPTASAPENVAPTGAPAGSPSLSAERAGQDTARRDGALEQRLQSAIAPAPTVTGLGAAAPALGRSDDAPAEPPAELAEADAETEPVSLVVPGLEVLDVLHIGEETAFLGTRALQLLPTGDTLETAHLPPGVDPTVLPPLRTGWSELVQPRGSGWLVMRAPVAPRELAELLRRLEGDR